MAKVTRKLRDLPILPTFIMLSITFLLIAMLLVEIEKTVFSNAQSEIAFRYSDIVEGFRMKKCGEINLCFCFLSRTVKECGCMKCAFGHYPLSLILSVSL